MKAGHTQDKSQLNPLITMGLKEYPICMGYGQLMADVERRKKKCACCISVYLLFCSRWIIFTSLHRNKQACSTVPSMLVYGGVSRNSCSQTYCTCMAIFCPITASLIFISCVDKQLVMGKIKTELKSLHYCSACNY